MDSYYSNEYGKWQVYITSFPKPGGKFLVGDGSNSVWRRDGKELFYVDSSNRIVSVQVTSRGESLELGQPQTLKQLPRNSGNVFHVSGDGQTLPDCHSATAEASGLSLVVNCRPTSTAKTCTRALGKLPFGNPPFVPKGWQPG